MLHYNVRKVGALSNMPEERMLELDECYLQDKAAAWMMRLEKTNKKLTTITELQECMISEFVPSYEVTRAKHALVKIKYKSNIENHISRFQDYVEICSTPLSEEYLFFFLSLPPKYREKYTRLVAQMT